MKGRDFENEMYFASDSSLEQRPNSAPIPPLVEQQRQFQFGLVSSSGSHHSQQHNEDMSRWKSQQQVASPLYDPSSSSRQLWSSSSTAQRNTRRPATMDNCHSKLVDWFLRKGF